MATISTTDRVITVRESLKELLEKICGQNNKWVVVHEYPSYYGESESDACKEFDEEVILNTNHIIEIKQ